MNRYSEFYSAVDEIYSCVKRDLYGVSSENEVLEDIEPLSTYVTGILYPRKASQVENQIYIEDYDDGEYGDIDIENQLETDDDTIAASNNYKPSSMGISVMLPADLTAFDICFSCGLYKHLEDTINEKIVHKYCRTPFSISFTVDVSSIKSTFSKRLSENIDADIKLVVRKIMPDGSKLLTISIINNSIETNKLHLRNENALFQCEIHVIANKPFLPIYQNLYTNDDVETQIRCLIYKDINNYGYGHGCSVAYDETENGVLEIRSEFLPHLRIKQMMPGAISDDTILKLNNWCTLDRNILIEKTNSFIDEYSKWKEEKEKINVDISLVKAKNKLLDNIRICIDRLKQGVTILTNNENAWKSFVMMNEAMMLQRVNQKHQQIDNILWYPFQLAYILQIIPDIVDPSNKYHNVVDLLWFPTGGGKTEAYLGVAAFSIFFRRLSCTEGSDGVTVIMRYTLRLLTIQQFERAAAMICACDYLRSKYDIPGGEISIGLWIGAGMTPNHIEKAEEVLQKLRSNKDEKIYEGNPVQITKCPWCGSKIDVSGYEISNHGMIIKCRDNMKCPFHEKLPIYVVDDDIYRNKPTLLLSTIDKFARIVWVDESKNLFGAHNNPPSLIIQDELHLISGSLGSLAGLYEIAVDYLCSRTGISPKIIASTATVKNADEQIRNIYGKEMIQFPPNGLSYDDSFFSHLANENERPARTYIGMCENGGSISDLMVRTYALLTFIKAMFIKQNKSKDIIDQYYTIVGYFNAIRDLGSSSNILQDRMGAHLRTLINRKFKDICESLGVDNKSVPYNISDELTSRKSSKEVKDTLENLEISYDNAGCYSYVLASNMLSVGIDINRLGLMTVFNQPKTNSEYIQATSRVGRSNPGVVLTMYNPMRSRDKSHYEQFNYYHNSFYQYVEATSVTPFSARAMEKALHCTFIAMVRLSIDELSGNNNAVFFNSSDQSINSIKEFILSRIRRLHPNSLETAKYLLECTIDEWENMTKIYPELCYYSNNSERVCLLNPAEGDLLSDFPLILNSLRNVEPSSNIYISK
ncbi:MAG: hypothetical protein IK093_10100 [Ruminiclostridium sp.]|nr:hypothetical protein [Ruminiclostridium sp.]